MNTKTTKAHQRNVCIGNIGDLAGGQAKAAINAAINAAIRDTEDRGDDKKARKVTIELEFKKVGENSVSTTVKAKNTIPPYVTDPTFGELTMNNGRPEIAFSPNSASNPDQPAIPMDD